MFQPHFYQRQSAKRLWKSIMKPCKTSLQWKKVSQNIFESAAPRGSMKPTPHGEHHLLLQANLSATILTHNAPHQHTAMRKQPEAMVLFLGSLQEKRLFFSCVRLLWLTGITQKITAAFHGYSGVITTQARSELKGRVNSMYEYVKVSPRADEWNYVLLPFTGKRTVYHIYIVMNTRWGETQTSWLLQSRCLFLSQLWDPQVGLIS